MTAATLPNRPTNGQPEDISQIIADFDALLNVINGNLDETYNLAPGKVLSPSRIKQEGATSDQIMMWDNATAKWMPKTFTATTVGTLAQVIYQPTSGGSKSTTSTSFVDVDATNLIFSFVAPATGKVLVDVRGGTLFNTTAATVFNLRDSGGDVAATQMSYYCTTNTLSMGGITMYKSGLTPGNTYNWKLGWKVVAGTSSWTIGDDTGNNSGVRIRVFAGA